MNTPRNVRLCDVQRELDLRARRIAIRRYAENFAAGMAGMVFVLVLFYCATNGGELCR